MYFFQFSKLRKQKNKHKLAINVEYVTKSLNFELFGCFTIFLLPSGKRRKKKELNIYCDSMLNVF